MSKKLNPLQAEYNRELGYLKSTITQGTKYGWHYPDIELPTIDGIPTEAQIEYVRQLRKEIYENQLTFKISSETGEVKSRKEIRRERRKGVKTDWITPSVPTPTGESPQEAQPYAPGFDTEIQDQYIDEEYEPVEDYLAEDDYYYEADIILNNLEDYLTNADINRTGSGEWRPNKGEYRAQDVFGSQRQRMLDIVENARSKLGNRNYAKYLNDIRSELMTAELEFEAMRYESEIMSAGTRLASLLNGSQITMSDNEFFTNHYDDEDYGYDFE